MKGFGKKEGEHRVSDDGMDRGEGSPVTVGSGGEGATAEVCGDEANLYAW